MLAEILTSIATIDKWLDDYVSPEYKDQPMAQDWARISKVTEESGEAVAEYVLFTGQNPRKPRTDTIDATLIELADTAITALLAIQHFTKDEARTGLILVTKVRAIARRANDDIVKRNREAARTSPDAMAAQRAWNDSLSM